MVVDVLQKIIVPFSDLAPILWKNTGFSTTEEEIENRAIGILMQNLARVDFSYSPL